MSLIIKMDAIKTEEHLRKSIPYIMNEKKTGGLCFSNSGITSEQIVDTFFLTKQIHPTLGTRQGYHFKFSFSKDETIEGEQALLFIKDWVDEYLTENYDYACSVHKDREHMHMHLVFNSVSRNGGKYRYEKGDWENVIRPLTNRLAQKYHTGPLKEKNPALDYSTDYDKKKENMTGRERVERDMDECILLSKSYADFKNRMVRDFYYRLREGVSREHGVYLALTPPGRGKAIRTYRLSDGYMPVDIDRRINAKEEKTFEDILDFHVKFERIHPFQDGNGRVGRLILFKECLKYNIVPFIIEDNLKLFYYRGLKEWDNEKGYLTDTCLTAQDKYKAYLDYFRIGY